MGRISRKQAEQRIQAVLVSANRNDYRELVERLESIASDMERRRIDRKIRKAYHAEVQENQRAQEAAISACNAVVNRLNAERGKVWTRLAEEYKNQTQS